MFLEIAGVLEAVFGATRVVFDFLNFIPAAVCVYHKHTVEKCRYNHFTASLNTIGAGMEALNSFTLLMALFLWKRFHVKNYFLALCRVGHFWVWFILCICYICSNFFVKSVEARDKNGKLSYLGVCSVLEVITLTFLAAAINFVARETYQYWIEQQVSSSKWRAFFSHLYCFVLCTYLFRNIGLFLYDTALVSMSISIIKGTTTEAGEWDSLLLVLIAAFRGSFVKFFFAKIFQGQDLPKVCENTSEDTLPQVSDPRQRMGEYRILDAAASSVQAHLENSMSKTVSMDIHSVDESLYARMKPMGT